MMPNSVKFSRRACPLLEQATAWGYMHDAASKLAG